MAALLPFTPVAGAVVITEWMYQGANGEFVEFTNTGTTPVDLAGWSFDASHPLAMAGRQEPRTRWITGSLAMHLQSDAGAGARDPGEGGRDAGDDPARDHDLDGVGERADDRADDQGQGGDQQHEDAELGHELEGEEGGALRFVDYVKGVVHDVDVVAPVPFGENNLAGARVEIDAHKKNPADFVLWKSSSAGLTSLTYPTIRGLLKVAETNSFSTSQTSVTTSTTAAFGGTLAAYKFFDIKVGNKFRTFVIAAMFGMIALSLMEVVLSLFSSQLGLFGFGTMGLLFAVAGLVLGVFMLILDFDFVERGVAAGLPERESWRASFGLLVSLVWIYTNLLRILAILQSD